MKTLIIIKNAGHLQRAKIVLLASDTPAQVARPSPATEGHHVYWNLDGDDCDK